MNQQQPGVIELLILYASFSFSSLNLKGFFPAFVTLKIVMMFLSRRREKPKGAQSI